MNRAFDFHEFALVGQRGNRRGVAIVVELARVLQCLGGPALEQIQFAHQAFGTDRAPISGAHIFNDALDDLSLHFGGDQALVGRLLSAHVRQAEIENVPAKADIGRLDALFLRSRRLQALDARIDVDTV